MQIGCCAPGNLRANMKDNLLAAYEAVRLAGYDYLEASCPMIMALSDEEVTEMERLREEGVFALAGCNSFIPKTFRICQAEQLPALEEYVTNLFSRLQRLGAEFVVFGSGDARRLETEESVKAEPTRPASTSAQLSALDDFLKMCDEKAGPAGLTVVIEPLHKGETNTFNTVGAAAAWARKLNLEHVKLLADAFHTFKEGENLLVLEENADLLRHIHVAAVPERGCPGPEGDEYLREFAGHLHEARYQGRVSIECIYRDFEREIKEANSFMREIF